LREAIRNYKFVWESARFVWARASASCRRVRQRRCGRLLSPPIARVRGKEAGRNRVYSFQETTSISCAGAAKCSGRRITVRSKTRASKYTDSHSAATARGSRLAYDCCSACATSRQVGRADQSRARSASDYAAIDRWSSKMRCGGWSRKRMSASAWDVFDHLSDKVWRRHSAVVIDQFIAAVSTARGVFEYGDGGDRQFSKPIDSFSRSSNSAANRSRRLRHRLVVVRLPKALSVDYLDRRQLRQEFCTTDRSRDGPLDHEIGHLTGKLTKRNLPRIRKSSKCCAASASTMRRLRSCSSQRVLKSRRLSCRLRSSDVNAPLPRHSISLPPNSPRRIFAQADFHLRLNRALRGEHHTGSNPLRQADRACVIESSWMSIARRRRK